MITLEDGGMFQRRTKKACLQLIGRLEKIAMKTTLNLSSVSQLNEDRYRPTKYDIKQGIICATTDIE